MGKIKSGDIYKYGNGRFVVFIVTANMEICHTITDWEGCRFSETMQAESYAAGMIYAGNIFEALDKVGKV